MDALGNAAASTEPLVDWQELLKEILRLEAPVLNPEEDDPCACGRAGRFICDTCPDWLCCQRCVLLAHKQLPCHWIQEWISSDFLRRSLRDLGMRVLLGHSGDECHMGRAECIKVTTDEGVVPVEVIFCGLNGSSRSNPWNFQENGPLRLDSDVSGPFPIATGTPNTSNGSVVRTATKVRTARRTVIENTPPGTAHPRLSAPAALAALVASSARTFHVGLRPADLYLDEARPPELTRGKDYHTCGLCGNVKSHPMSYMCGHSHCYVCIRLSLERVRWCLDPECLTRMYCAPFHHYGEEMSIASDYPEWHDRSRVAYTWEGLVFPGNPKAIIVLDSP
ncbi:hypothetical protein C8R44DRAFT_872919 [Mycena epipterygia]|nr:hypothetical protein C8R44DRAFT_872919 [Mycena epipterygia]